MYRIYEKYTTTSLIVTGNLYLSEFQCKCKYSECSYTQIYSKTVESFSRLRNLYGKPIRVTSAFRCQMHNRDVGGLNKSLHKLGHAMDLRPTTIVLDMTNPPLDVLEDLAKTCFDVVVRYDTFIHCHNNI